MSFARAALSLVRPLIIVAAAWGGAARAEPPAPDPAMQARLQALPPALESYIEDGMKAFDCPGLAIGIVADDRLVYSRGFGVRGKADSASVDARTLFQIGSTTKAFLSATMALMVDRGKFQWSDRVVDLDPEFQLADPWATREFRMFDLMAQRSGLPPYVNDSLAVLAFDRTALIRSLRHVEPVSSFRTTFSYTNITHLVAGRIVAKAAGAADWNAVLQAELLEPLGMKDTSYTAEAMEAAADHAGGHRWTPDGTVEVPFTQIFPYDYDGAGDINSNIEDMARWMRLQLGEGEFEGRRIVSAENLAATRTPKVSITDKAYYALGWVVQQTPNGDIVWHNGGTLSFGAYVGMSLDRHVGVIVLSNETNVGFPDAVGRWTLDRLLGNASIDHVANALKAAKAGFEKDARLFAAPEHPRPFPPLAPLVGEFANRDIGKVAVASQGNGLTMEFAATGAKLTLQPWDGDVFTASLAPEGKFAAIAADSGPRPMAFAQFQIDADGKLNRLRLSMDDGQAYLFERK